MIQTAAATTNCNCSRPSSSSSLQTLLHLQLPAFSFSPSFSVSSFSTKKLLIPFPTFPLSLTPTTTRPTNTAYSLLDDGASGSAIEVAEVDPYLALKNKATEIASELRGTSIYLVGINSRIKTSLGKFIADALRYYFFDSDNLIEEAAGGDSAGKKFRERDEKGFHESETEVLKQLSSMGRLVVSAGDGAVESAMNLSLLRHGILIWIDLPLDMVAREAVEHGLQLPALELSTSGSYSEVFAQLTDLYKQMQGGYATADATISLQKVAWQLGYDDLDAVTVEDMGLEVLKEIERLMRVKKLMEEAARPF